MSLADKLFGAGGPAPELFASDRISTAELYSEEKLKKALQEATKKRKRPNVTSKNEEEGEKEEEEAELPSSKRRKTAKESKAKAKDSAKAKGKKAKQAEEEQSEEEAEQTSDAEMEEEEERSDEMDSDEEKKEAFEEYRRALSLPDEEDGNQDSDDEDAEEVEQEEDEKEEEEKEDKRGKKDQQQSPAKAKAKAPLGKAPAVDEDSEEEEDDDAEPKPAKQGSLTAEERMEQEKRTIFVGGLSVKTKKKKLMSVFKKYGEIESIRFRNIAFAKTGSNEFKKVEWRKKDFHPERDSMNAYIRFAKVSFAKAALAEHNSVINDKHIRVDMALGSAKQDWTNCVFVGNLPFGAEEEDLFEIFDTQAGPVDSVRIVRDEFYKVSKGFAYVKMQSEEGMQNAILLNGRVNYQGRFIRVTKAITDKNQLEAMKNAVAFQKRKRLNTKKKTAKQITNKLKQKVSKGKTKR